MAKEATLTVTQAYDGAFMAELPLQDWATVDGMLATAAGLLLAAPLVATVLSLLSGGRPLR